MAKKPSPAASVIEKNVQVHIEDEIFLSIKDTAKMLGISSKYLLEQLRNPERHWSRLAPFFKDVNGGVGRKPMWRIALRDLRDFKASLPTMAESAGGAA